MSIDLELETWREQWRQESAVPTDLRRRVERQSRRMRIMRACEILITVVFGGGTILSAVRSGRADVWVLAALTWVSIAIAWAMSLMSTHDLWSPASADHAAFLDLSIRRCRAQIQATVLAALLYCFNLAFTLAWVYRAQPLRNVCAFLISWRVCVVWAVTLIFFVWMVRHRRAKRVELARLESMLN